jgi:DNA-directed RNA polymerase subunit K/omega
MAPKKSKSVVNTNIISKKKTNDKKKLENTESEDFLSDSSDENMYNSDELISPTGKNKKHSDKQLIDKFENDIKNKKKPIDDDNTTEYDDYDENEIEIDPENNNSEDIDDSSDESDTNVKLKKINKKKNNYSVSDETETPSCYLNNIDDGIEEYDYEETFDDDNKIFNDLVDPKNRITKPYLTKYERVRLLSERTKQISLGAKPMIKNIYNLTPKEITNLEIINKTIPLIIERVLPNGKREHWNIKELEIIN